MPKIPNWSKESIRGCQESWKHDETGEVVCLMKEDDWNSPWLSEAYEGPGKEGYIEVIEQGTNGQRMKKATTRYLRDHTDGIRQR